MADREEMMGAIYALCPLCDDIVDTRVQSSFPCLRCQLELRADTEAAAEWEDDDD